jgi:hypothetical protein
MIIDSVEGNSSEDKAEPAELHQQSWIGVGMDMTRISKVTGCFKERFSRWGCGMHFERSTILRFNFYSAMKKILLILAAIFGLIGFINAQTTNRLIALSPKAAGMTGKILGYQIGQQGANQRNWLKIVQTTDLQGRTVLHTNLAYVEMASGLNHLVNGRYVPSKAEIDIQPDGTAAATNGQCQVFFPSDIYNGRIKLVMPGGSQELVSQPVGLSLDDGNNTILIAVLTNSIGELVSSNQVVYKNAFSGINADLRYTYTLSGLEQDVILHEQPPAPAALNLNAASAKIQVLTEFFNGPQPQITRAKVRTEAGDLTDDTLNFGPIQMARGKAFLLGTNLPSARVLKKWVQIQGRTFLMEEVPLKEMQKQLEHLPRMAASRALDAPLKTMAQNWVLPPAHPVEEASTAQPIQIAMAAMPSQGLVLDYKTVNASYSTYDFQGDKTYYVSGNSYINNATVEGGAVVKFPSGVSLMISGIMTCKTGPYDMACFTSVNDDSVGETSADAADASPIALWSLSTLITRLFI